MSYAIFIILFMVIIGGLGSIFGSFAGAAFLVLIPVVTFYLLRDWDRMLANIDALLPKRVQPTVAKLAGEIDAVLAEFLRGQLSVMFALAVVYAAGLWLVGLELAIFIGIAKLTLRPIWAFLVDANLIRQTQYELILDQTNGIKLRPSHNHIRRWLRSIEPIFAPLSSLILVLS